jgi:hypothetical protein
MIRIKKFDGSYFLKIDHSDINHVLDIYLHKLNQIPDFQQLDTENITEKMLEIAIESNDVFLLIVCASVAGDKVSMIVFYQLPVDIVSYLFYMFQNSFKFLGH